MIPLKLSSCGEVKNCRTILQHQVLLCIILLRLSFCIRPLIIGVVVYRVFCFMEKKLDVLVLNTPKCVVIETADISIEEKYLIVGSGGATYDGKFCHEFNPPISIHITGWCVVNYLVQWNVEFNILGVLLFLVHNYGQHEALPIDLYKYK